MVYLESPDILDKTAATLMLQSVIGRDLDSIAQLFNRIEGGALLDEELVGQQQSMPI
jgi:hypothetical protein